MMVGKTRLRLGMMSFENVEKSIAMRMMIAGPELEYDTMIRYEVKA